MVSALLCAALDAYYWKPIQTGTREGTDRQTVMQLAEIPAARTIPENLSLCAAGFAASGGTARGSSHRAAENSACRESGARENLIVEGAGGALVPINDTQLMTDLMRHLKLPVLLVARTALGTINHTLLSLAALRAARLDIRGVVMVGKKQRESESHRTLWRSRGRRLHSAAEETRSQYPAERISRKFRPQAFHA